MIRFILGVLAGIATGLLAITAIERIGHMIWPLPRGLDMRDMAAFGAALTAMPVGALATVVAGWTIGAFAGALIARLIARRAAAGWIVVGLVLTSILLNAAMIPAPMWMPVAGVILVLLAGWLAARLAGSLQRRGEAAPSVGA